MTKNQTIASLCIVMTLLGHTLKLPGDNTDQEFRVINLMDRLKVKPAERVDPFDYPDGDKRPNALFPSGDGLLFGYTDHQTNEFFDQPKLNELFENVNQKGKPHEQNGRALALLVPCFESRLGSTRFQGKLHIALSTRKDMLKVDARALWPDREAKQNLFAHLFCQISKDGLISRVRLNARHPRGQLSLRLLGPLGATISPIDNTLTNDLVNWTEVRIALFIRNVLSTTLTAAKRL